ncbi:MAG: hypothetical protein JSR54_01325 [Proteobacteria bacterium]|nr:hypothetical protein [Pseudomonadota bacterium]
MFLKAFPDDSGVRSDADAALRDFAGRVGALPSRERARLADTGIAGTTTRHCFEAPIAAWLVARYPDAVSIDWSAVADSGAIDSLIGLVAQRAEQDGLESQDLSTRRWLAVAAGQGRGADLEWLLRQLVRSSAIRLAWQPLYDQAAVPVAWRLRSDTGSTTVASWACGRRAFRAGGLRRLPSDPRRLMATPLPGIRRLGLSEAEEVIDVTRAALAARCREVYAVTHANPEEVYLAELGAGTSMALIGVVRSRRLSLESNYGYLLLSNDVPVGYAGVTPLYRQANTGINVFEPFRGSEAAYLYAQVLRAFRTLFGVRRFVLNPYQIGAGNREAIESGAFWFYYRLGFRPVDAALATLAAREQSRRVSRPRYRTARETLARLARSDVELVLPGARQADRFQERWLTDLSLLASRQLAAAERRDRGTEAAEVARRVAHALGLRDLASWDRGEREAFVALAPLVALLDLRALDSGSRAALLRTLRAKGAAQELGYVRAASADPVLLPGLMAIARRAGAP